MEQRASKKFYQLDGGLNTDINELNFPEGYTRDEANYELLYDGSRRRRKGLAAESGASTAKTVQTFRTAHANQAYLWSDAGGDPTKNVMVYQQGNTLYFADADSIVSDGWYAIPLDATNFYSGSATAALVEDQTLSFTQGRGYLFVTGPYVLPFYVEYDATGDTFAAYPISVRVRDYSDIEDGIAIGGEPTDATIPADHNYNLRNRGWRQTDIDQYKSDQSKWPAKNAYWWRGYKRTYGASIREEDGIQSWDSAKLDAEIFGNSSAAKGSLVLDPFDTTYGIGGANSSLANQITTWTYTGTGTWEVTITTQDAHGFSPTDDVLISNMTSTYFDTDGAKKVVHYSGSYTCKTGTTGSTIIVDIPEPYLFDSFLVQYRTYGYVDGDVILSRSSGSTHGDSFDAIAFHAGHIFYGGMKNSEWADTIMFSQVATTTDKFGKCYSEADPTDQDFNAQVATDGGYIVVPGLSGVVGMATLRSSLIVLAKEGVYEVSGSRGLFTATDHNVKMLSSAGCNSPTGFVVGENIMLYTGPDGIYAIGPNQYTGMLEVTSISDNTIATEWAETAVAVQEHCQMLYDPSLKKFYILLGPDGSTTMAITKMLIFNARLRGAWTRYTFDAPSNNVLLTGFMLPNVDDATNNQRAKFLYQVSTTTVQVADFNQTSFDDWDGTNGPLPYLVFGHDNIGDWQPRRQAPVITVFSKRTETGYTEGGGGYEADNESSTLMSAYWDWTDDAVTNKIGAQQEVYRHVRNFVPSGTTDVDGYPVVVTRNKVRGRGRSLQLRFDGATDKDSHILGFQVNYRVTRKV